MDVNIFELFESETSNYNDGNNNMMIEECCYLQKLIVALEAYNNTLINNQFENFISTSNSHQLLNEYIPFIRECTSNFSTDPPPIPTPIPSLSSQSRHPKIKNEHESHDDDMNMNQCSDFGQVNSYDIFHFNMLSHTFYCISSN